MVTNTALQFQRKPWVLKQLKCSNSTLYNRMDNKLFVPPVSLCGRMVAWIESEVNSILAAMAAGKSNDEIKELVSILVEQRKSIMEDL